MVKFLSLALIVAVAAPVTATAATVEAGAEAEKPKRERVICKREPTIGSLVKKKRTCLTPEGWKQAKRNNEENVKEWQEVVSSTSTAN